MRFRSLDLIRYGHFTNLSLQFPSVGPDFHIVYGENEAGKSTTMAAIEDLLFGIPAQSPRNFLHDNAALRIGATLERDAAPFVLRRRKGNKDTLLGPDDMPLPAGDRMLGRLLGGVDRAFFGRMFCLDHERLRAGGRDIVQARDDVGATLFAAGAGVSGLRALLASMEDEADGLWASRKAGHRTYYQAEERLKQADAALRQHTVTAARWQELKSALDEARQACAAIEAEIEERTAERNKMTRVRRVSRGVHRLAEIEREIAALGAVPDLPADAAAQLERAAAENTAAQARIETIEEQIAGLEAECAALVIDEIVLRHGPDIERLSKRQIELAPERSSLPRRRAELALAEEALARAADELEWAGQTAELVGRIPARAKVAVVRALLTSRGSCFAVVENAAAGLADAREALRAAQDRIETAGTAHDVTALAGVVKSVRALGDLDGRLQAAERDRREADDLCRRQLAMLTPAVAGEEELHAMKVPPAAAVRAARDAARDLEARIRSQQAAVRDLMRSVENNRKAYGRLVSDEKIVSVEDLERLRRHRDTGWSIIRRRFLEQGEVPEPEQRAFAGGDGLQAAYEAAVSQADAAADRRFQKAESTAASMVLARQIAELEDQLASQSDELTRLTDEQQALAAAWRDLWKCVTGTPRAPDDMLDWIEARAALLDQIAKRDGAARLVNALRTGIAGAKRQLLGLLQDAAIAAAAEELTLNAVLAAAEEHVRASDAIATRRAELEHELRKLGADVERKRKAVETAEAARADWEARWRAAVTDLNLSAGTAVETVAAQIEAVETMREIAARIVELQQERIGKIERDINAFAAEVEALVSIAAPSVVGKDADDAARAMHARFQVAVQAHAARQEKNETISSLRRKRQDCAASGKEARRIIDQLRLTAGAATIDALRLAIRRSDRLRELRDEEARLRKTLEADGDGFGVEALAEECRTIGLDQAGAREQTLAQTLKELRERQIEAAQRRSDAARLFDAVGGDAGAAQAASNRQAALADMNEAAARYARIRSASIVLRWAVERFRREKQAPLLRRAGELFSILTGGSFERLTTRYDDKDVPHLAGVRPDGSTVGVSGLSDGTSDQLFLALRIAAIEEYLAHAGPTPFIADDLFINYDLDRAAAGFRVLRQLAEKTQVLFFTHHEHLVEVARAAFGGSVWASEIEGRPSTIRNVA